MQTRVTATALVGILLAATLVACSDDDTEAEASDERTQLAPLGGGAPELDVSTSQAETEAGVIDARRVDLDTYVGDLPDGLHVAVSVGEQTSDPDRFETVVYLCDGEVADLLTGEIGPEPNTLQGAAMNVELVWSDEAVTGTVTRDGDQAEPFTAELADGDAGLYSASFTHDEIDYRPFWVVLDDGSQQGGACWRCCSGSHCDICCPTTADTAGPTVDWTELQYWWVRLWRE